MTNYHLELTEEEMKLLRKIFKVEKAIFPDETEKTKRVIGNLYYKIDEEFQKSELERKVDEVSKE